MYSISISISLSMIVSLNYLRKIDLFYSPNHLKTGPFKIRMYLSGLQMVGLPDFRSHLNSRPFATQPFLTIQNPD